MISSVGLVHSSNTREKERVWLGMMLSEREREIERDRERRNVLACALVRKMVLKYTSFQVRNQIKFGQTLGT